jgi:outer membrane protein assembly factor BamB
VVVAPNCGSVIAVDRFAGKIRWVSAYRSAASANVAQPAGDRGDRWMRAGERERALQMRYKSTPVICGDVVVSLAQDAAALFAFDRVSGKRLWESEAAVGEALGLAGASGNMAITCGAGLAGIDAGGTGKLKWKFTPKRGIHLTGPAVVLGGTVLAPTSAGIMQLDAADGSEKTTYTVPDFRRLMTTDGGRSAVIGAGAGHAFGMPSEVR